MKKRMEELVGLLSNASRQYYQNDTEIMSNQEYDRLYDELAELEKKTGITLSSSPTVNVGYEVVSNLPKERHPLPMLSLDKTKEIHELEAWLGDREALLSWKLDGLTVVLTYEDGNLTKAVTRGDGKTGEVITANAKSFENIPLKIPAQEEVVVRGEAVISYPDFKRINEEILEESGGDEALAASYKNPRNLCSGSVRQLNSKITASRHVKFYAFSLAAGGEEGFRFRHEQIKWMQEQGLETVKNVPVTSDNIESAVEAFAKEISEFEIPSDGLVLIFDDIDYGKSLGSTAKFPRDAIAFKWQDELKETELKEIIWNASRTGLINPIAVFEPVELEGTTVSRASVHNLSIVEELALGVGDRIRVYKANMIIPQIAENLTKSGNISIPGYCPVCGAETEIRNENGVRTLHCPNGRCPAKRIKSFTHFVSRNAMNIEGLSEASLEKFVDEAIITCFGDIFRLESRRDRIVEMEGFGQRSFEKLVAAVEKARHTSPDRLLYALGIPNIGVANARMIAKACKNKWDKIQSLNMVQLVEIDGIGDTMAKAYVDFFADKKKAETVADLLSLVDIDESFREIGESSINGKTFVITGTLKHFENRDEAKLKIESLGGKTSGSVSSKTDFLINNDIESRSSKNKKAKELGVPIISEEEFLEMINQ